MHLCRGNSISWRGGRAGLKHRAMSTPVHAIELLHHKSVPKPSVWARVKNNTDERTVGVRIRNADHRCRTDLLGHAETCHTSPRSGTMPGVLLRIERPERFRRNHPEIVLGEIVGHGDALRNQPPQLNALWNRKLLHLFEDLGYGLSHEWRICALGFRASEENGLIAPSDCGGPRAR